MNDTGANTGSQHLLPRSGGDASTCKPPLLERRVLARRGEVVYPFTSNHANNNGDGRGSCEQPKLCFSSRWISRGIRVIENVY